MEEKLSPKVEALCKAVMELLLEGKEIRKMKVSEITEQAGIGKGTAYEYFESREELLVRALGYQQRIWAENIREELSHHDGLMEQLDRLFDLLDRIIQSVKKEALEEICNIFFLYLKMPFPFIKSFRLLVINLPRRRKILADGAE